MSLILTSCWPFNLLLPNKGMPKRELPSATLSDESLEKQMVDACNKKAKSSGWKETFTKAIITGDWYVRRNDVTGVVVGRTREAAVVATWPNGRCTFQYFDFYQEYYSGNFNGDVQFYSIGSQYDTNCEQIK